MQSRTHSISKTYTASARLNSPSALRGGGASITRHGNVSGVSLSLSPSRGSASSSGDAERLAYSPLEAAKAIGVGLSTMRALLKSNRIKSKKLAGRVLVSRESLLAFVNN